MPSSGLDRSYTGEMPPLIPCEVKVRTWLAFKHKHPLPIMADSYDSLDFLGVENVDQVLRDSA